MFTIQSRISQTYDIEKSNDIDIATIKKKNEKEMMRTQILRWKIELKDFIQEVKEKSYSDLNYFWIKI